MPEPLPADRTAELLLWYFQEPGRYRAEGRRRDAPLLDSEVVLKLALGRRVEFFLATLNDAQTVATLRDAAALYVRFLFFRPDATPYQILGLAPGTSPQAIKESFRLLMQLVHPDRQDARVVWPDSFAAQANRAYGVLRNQDARANFDREAEARAAMARAMHRAAAASAASKMPVVLRPRPGLGRGGALRRAMLPEWLTAGVGGYARAHPAATAFAALIGTAALTVGAMVWERHEGELTREVEATPRPAAPTAVARVPASDGIPPLASGVPEAPVVTADSRPPPRAAPTLASAAVADSGATRVPLPILLPESLVPVARAAPPEAFAPAPVPAIANVEPGLFPEPPVAGTSPGAAVGVPVLTAAPAVAGSSVSANLTIARAEPVATAMVPAVAPLPPATTEIETLFATFVEAYERGRIDAFAALFDDDADTNLRHGRAAIRGEYDELFRLSQWRKMQLTRVNWKRVGDRTVAKGEITVRIGWRDGREVEQRLAMDMELVRRDGRVVIARLSQQTKN